MYLFLHYLFVAIDDYSRELYAAIPPDKTAASAGSFLGQVLEECAYTIETAYTDNGKEFQGNPEHRRKSQARFVNDCNGVKPHKALGTLTPGDRFCLFFFSQNVVNSS